MHSLLLHAFDDIEAKGVSANFSTKPSESMHRQYKLAYQLQTNFKNVVPQVCVLYMSFRAWLTSNIFVFQLLELDHKNYVATHIKEQLNELEIQAEADARAEAEATGAPKKTSSVITLGNITLGAVQLPRPVDDIEQERVTSDIAFTDFRLRLQRWISTNIQWNSDNSQGAVYRLLPTEQV